MTYDYDLESLLCIADTYLIARSNYDHTVRGNMLFMLYGACNMVGAYADNLCPLVKAIRRHGRRQKRQGRQWDPCNITTGPNADRIKQYIAQ